jgi:TolB-like protein/class 3 adenylate cyclase/predicted Zn-dependent protease
MAREQRRLAAIVSVDVVGYSRLMGSDDSGTLARWKALRSELIEPKVAEYGGRIVNTAGDNQLQEFPSVVDAVRCSVDVQRGMAKRNRGAPAHKRIDLRIGINIGDIIDDGVGIFGDGVNVAARVQSLAPPGGICASKVVRDQVLDKLNFTFEDLGEQEVKNIARAIEVYRVDFGEALPAPGSGRGLWQRMKQSVAGFGWRGPQRRDIAAEPAALRLAVAVLPFKAHGGDPEEEQFADTLTQDLTSELGWMRMTQVVSRDLAAPYKGKAIDPRTVGRELDASYLVEGEVHRVDQRIEVNAQLIEASSAAQLWSERLEIAQTSGTENIASLLSRLDDRIVSAIKTATMRRFAGPPAPDANALELTWHAYSVWQRDRNTVRGALEARKWFEQALRRDDNFLPAMRGQLSTLQSELEFDSNADYRSILREMDKLSLGLVTIDSSDYPSWHQRTETLMRLQRWEAALEANAKAERVGAGRGGVVPGLVFNSRAEIMLLTGRPDDALSLVDQQLALDSQNQHDLGWAMLQRGRAFMALGRYDEAITASERAVALNNWWLPHLYLVAGYALTDKLAKAKAEKASLFELRPDTTIADFKRLYWSDNLAFVQQTEAHLLAGLRKAGFPEGEALHDASEARRFGRRLTRFLSWRWLATAGVAIGLVAIGFWMVPQLWGTGSPSPSPRSAVAILPFAAGASPEEEALANELSRELTPDGSPSSNLIQVVSRDLVAPYKGKPVDPRKVGRELDATYLVEGEVRRQGNGRIEFNLQIIEAPNATPVWGERLEIAEAGTTKDMTAALLSQLGSGMFEGLKTAFFRQFAGPPAPNAGPAELVWHGGSVMYSHNNTVPAALEARKWFDQALRLDPNYVPAIRARWRTLEYELDFAPKPDVNRILHEMDELSFRAVSIDSANGASWQYRTDTLLRQGRYEAALEASAKSGCFPERGCDSWPAIHRAGIMLQMGRPKEALELADRSVGARNQEEAGWANLQRCRACMALGRLDEAIAACEKDVALDNWWLPHLYLVAGYALRGETVKASAEEATLLELRPGTSIVDFKKLYWSDNAAFVQQTETHLLAGLRKAGFPEQ